MDQCAALVTGTQPIHPRALELCQGSVGALAAAGYEEPTLHPVQDGSVDMNWPARGVYCTLEYDGAVRLTLVRRPLTRPVAPHDIHVDTVKIFAPSDTALLRHMTDAISLALQGLGQQ